MRDLAASGLEINATPTFFVNGQRLSGGHNLDNFDQILAPIAH